MEAKRQPIFVSALVERFDGFVLICRPHGADHPRRWEFPGGLARDDESPEAAMRRLATERAGIHIEISVGQPPLLGHRDGQELEHRYFLGGLSAGQAEPIDYAEVRWIAKGQLCEYDFDSPTREVVDWCVCADRDE